MAQDLFDRKINVYIYDSAYSEIGKVLTPNIGPKPEIKVEGTLISNTYSISSKVTITNIERSIPVEQAKYLYVELFYGGATDSRLKKGFLYNVLYADQSKQPPDREVCFNCLVAGTSPDIMQQRCSIGEVDAEGNPVKQTLDALLRKVISCYNLALARATRNVLLMQTLLLEDAPLYRMHPIYAEKYKAKEIAYQCSNKMISTVIDELSSASTEKESINEQETLFTEYYALNFYIENNRLVVVTAPSESAELINEEGVIDLNYVISAYRCGPVIHCSALFDPRIHQDATIRISRNAVLGKKVSGELIPLSGEILKFRPVGGIKYAFSTTKDNYMQMQGIAYASNSVIPSYIQ